MSPGHQPMRTKVEVEESTNRLSRHLQDLPRDDQFKAVIWLACESRHQSTRTAGVADILLRYRDSPERPLLNSTHGIARCSGVDTCRISRRTESRVSFDIADMTIDCSSPLAPRPLPSPLHPTSNVLQKIIRCMSKREKQRDERCGLVVEKMTLAS